MDRDADAHVNATVVAGVRRELEGTFARVMGSRPQAVALVDFPMHENVGDLAIWAGELELLERCGLPVAYACDVYGYRRAQLERALGPEDPILLHGGGNFGDLWPGFQAFRERVIDDFPGRRIVQLPQTLRYADPAAADRTRAVLNRHGGVAIMVRDDNSARIASDALGAECVLAPDSAFALDLPAQAPAVEPVVWLRRTDHEAGKEGPATDGTVSPVDWEDHPGFAVLRTAGRVHKRTTARLGPVGTGVDRALGRLYATVARRRVALGVRMIARGEVLVTDRLHAHILAVLVGRRNVVVDNSYGKVYSFIDRWTAASPLVTRAASHAEGLALARTAAEVTTRT